MTTHPSEGERYYLRLLLSKVRYPTSFDDLRTFNGVQVETFQEAALIRDLLQNDNNQEICLQETSVFHMPYEMRQLFATVLVYSCPNDPKALWQNFESSMSEDFAKCSAMTSAQVKRNVLQQIDGFLQSMGKSDTGKTFLYRALLADVRTKGYLALATATSGIVASILPGGRTAHSRFKISIDIFDGATCRVSKQTSLAAMIKEEKLIIWDEAPMSKKAAIEALDDLLRDLMNSKEVFGGKVVVLGGDFRQTLPVVRKGTKAEMINACLINSPLWHKLEKLQLTENMRAKLDPSFTQFLLKIGDGTQETDENDIVKLPSSIIVNYNNETDAIEKLINIVYPEFKDPSKKLHCSQNRAILTTKNNFVDEINDQLIEKFSGDLTEYLSYDETLNENHQSKYIDLLNTLTPSNLPPHRLLLKPNAPIILLKNLDPTEGLCNGTRLIIKSLSKNVICAKIAVGDFCGKEVFIHRISMQPPSDEQYPVPYKRTQFPIRLCFVMTINKAQGQTLDFVSIYLKEPVFSHGQLYVTLSRAKTASAVKVLIRPTYFDESCTDHTKNIVYKEVLEASQITLSVLDIQKGAEKWTVLAQVVQRGHNQLTREVSPRRIMRFLLTDTEPYQRYYVSNAIVVPADPTYRIGTYECSWILNYKTLIENYAEPVPPMLPCIFELTNFSDLHKYVDSDNLCNIRGFVIHALPVKQADPDCTSRDIIIVNKE
ncbi:uncharacterized protein [Coffea arabica]|uniref:ATP-dependent DNA helicase n=1 Tax=Coffea arabica TaxID=13443 RepID=A0A6P6W279_COFAR